MEQKDLVIQRTDFRLLELGKIKIGGLKEEWKTAKNGRKYHPPDKYDHFLITTTRRDSAGRLIPNEAVMKILGASPRELPITLLYDAPDKNFPTFFAVYLGSKKVCWGNGKIGERRVYVEEKKGGEIVRSWLNKWEDIKCEGTECKYFKAGTCQKHGILSCVLDVDPCIGGVYVFRTSGGNSIDYLKSAMLTILLKTGGILAGIPLKMIVQPELKETPTGKHMIHTVSILFRGTSEEIWQLVEKVATYRAGIGAKLVQIASQIKMVTDESEVEQNAITQEFYPDNVEATKMNDTPKKVSPTVTPDDKKMPGKKEKPEKPEKTEEKTEKKTEEPSKEESKKATEKESKEEEAPVKNIALF